MFQAPPSNQSHAQHLERNIDKKFIQMILFVKEVSNWDYNKNTTIDEYINKLATKNKLTTISKRNNKRAAIEIDVSSDDDSLVEPKVLLFCSSSHLHEYHLLTNLFCFCESLGSVTHSKSRYGGFELGKQEKHNNT